MTYRAYSRPAEAPRRAAHNRAEAARRRAIANRCHGRRKSTAQNPLPHVWRDAGGDCMGCKHCPRVRTLTDVEYRAKYGVDRPPPRQQQAGQRRALPLWPLPVISLGVIAWAGQSTNSAPSIIAAGVGMLLVLFVWARR